MKTYYLKRADLIKFLDRLNRDYEVYIPIQAEGKSVTCDFNFKLPDADYYLEKLSRTEKENIVFNRYRTVEPLRTFFTFPQEKLDTSTQEKKIAIFGVKNCDLFSLKIQDFVFLGGDVSDPFYSKRRENTLLVAGDCIGFKEVCFCLALGINPFPGNDGFDLSFSPLDEGFLVDVGSPKADGIISKNASLFSPATANLISLRDKKRESIIKKLKEHLAPHKIPSPQLLQEVVKAGYESELWQEEALRCVECGGCNFACDTCHCFLLADDRPQGHGLASYGQSHRFGNANKRARLWDACLYANFARVAGGANPLKYRSQRLRNRYLKKFDFFPDNLGLAACCGCGRCIDVCPAKIDIRKILRILAETSPPWQSEAGQGNQKPVTR